MCGIAGFSGEDRDKIERMTMSLRHRGPDGQGAYVGHGASLGHTRLAILDTSPAGAQPMWNEARTVVITYNGEIFNYRQIKEEERFQCRTGTDTEVILKLFEKYGMDFLPRLRGMFVFGIYDTRSRTWHLARDANGINPLFLAYPNGQLHFASETKALLKAFESKPALNVTALSQYLRLQYVPQPHTLCEGITQLAPGTVLTWKDGKESRSSFLPRVEPITFESPRDFRVRFPQIMDEAVKEHLVSDRPVGISLSGGMDSSIVLHHMCNHAKKPVRTYTVRFEATEEEGAKRFNTDADLAAMTAKHYGTDHHDILLTADMCREVYRSAACALDQPNADSAAMAQYVLAREAKKDVAVLLCGAAGDELFGGYPRYRVARVLEALRAFPAPLRSLAGKMAGYPSDVLRMQPGPALAERLLARPPQELLDVVKGDWFDPEPTSALFRARFSELHMHDPLRSFMEFDRHLWLVDESLRLLDATGLASGVECRIPFLDARVIAASHGAKSHWHVTLRRTKALLKDTYRPILPSHLFTLPKASFYPPLAKWIRRQAAPLVEEMLEHPRINELFDTVKLRNLFEAHKQHKTYALHTLSSLTQLAGWFEGVYDA